MIRPKAVGQERARWLLCSRTSLEKHTISLHFLQKWTLISTALHLSGLLECILDKGVGCVCVLIMWISGCGTSWLRRITNRFHYIFMWDQIIYWIYIISYQDFSLLPTLQNSQHPPSFLYWQAHLHIALQQETRSVDSKLQTGRKPQDAKISWGETALLLKCIISPFEWSWGSLPAQICRLWAVDKKYWTLLIWCSQVPSTFQQHTNSSNHADMAITPQLQHDKSTDNRVRSEVAGLCTEKELPKLANQFH